jgi:hypothetical protein
MCSRLDWGSGLSACPLHHSYASFYDINLQL